MLFVGINPAGPEIRGAIRDTSAIGRLHKWARTLRLKYFSFVNVIQEPGGAHSQTRVAGQFVRDCFTGGCWSAVVALGNVPSRALTKLGIPHFTLPHPSFRNRKLNDPDYEKQVLEECRAYIRRKI